MPAGQHEALRDDVRQDGRIGYGIVCLTSSGADVDRTL